MECYSGLKRNELSSHEKTWRKLKSLLGSERNPEKAVYCMILTDILEKAKLWNNKKFNGFQDKVGGGGVCVEIKKR